MKPLEEPFASIVAGRPAEIDLRGFKLLSARLFTKDLAFRQGEREAFGLRGLLPDRVQTIEEQVQLEWEHLSRKDDALEQYIGLAALQDRNATLFYRLLAEHLEELMPVVYTPTVGQACQQFSHILRRTRGIWITPDDIDRIPQVLRNSPYADVRLIVVTDNERILGLGDQGAGGMGIPIGKLALYVVGAGLYPYRTLPVLLDMGTDNQALRDDPLYLGERTPRLPDERFYPVVDAFIDAVHGRWPRALIQFEDFSNAHALPLLERWRERLLCFNDDIQGTGAVALAGLYGALRITGGQLADQRVLFLGAGSAARGIADSIAGAIAAETHRDLDRARSQLWMLDSKGLVTASRQEPLAPHKRPYAHPLPDSTGAGVEITDLTAAIRALKPTVLIGVSGQAGGFTDAALREMRRYCTRPVIFPLSNPTTRAECSAEQAYSWTDGDALVATGSPFAPVTVNNRLLVPGQCNNLYIFPGVGMGAVSCRASRITDAMFHAAARTLADQVGEDSLAVGRLFPDLRHIREISARIAAAVCRVAVEQGLAGIEAPPNGDGDWETFIRARMYHPHYVPYEPA
jgi:malate dehydrogenase (oxaloacetate-decarboxylating)(NADP+)